MFEDPMMIYDDMDTIHGNTFFFSSHVWDNISLCFCVHTCVGG